MSLLKKISLKEDLSFRIKFSKARSLIFLALIPFVVILSIIGYSLTFIIKLLSTKLTSTLSKKLLLYIFLILNLGH